MGHLGIVRRCRSAARRDAGLVAPRQPLYQHRMRHLVVVALLLFGAGCAHYSVMAQGLPDERAVRETAPIRATAIEFAFQQPGWESDAEWNEHVRAWNEAYLAGLAKAGRDLGPRQPQPSPRATLPSTASSSPPPCETSSGAS